MEESHPFSRQLLGSYSYSVTRTMISLIERYVPRRAGTPRGDIDIRTCNAPASRSRRSSRRVVGRSQLVVGGQLVASFRRVLAGRRLGAVRAVRAVRRVGTHLRRLGLGLLDELAHLLFDRRELG